MIIYGQRQGLCGEKQQSVISNKTMKTIKIWLLIAIAFFSLNIQPALAFCGFYVAIADTDLYNQASQVIIARDGQRTILTMSNDYQGEAKDFAMVVPVPVVLKEEQVHINEAKILKRLDDFSAPRLVEYFDPNPCQRYRMFDNDVQESALPSAQAPSRRQFKNKLGVTVEEEFSIGEYDIVILSAKESDGLEKWLIQNGY